MDDTTPPCPDCGGTRAVPDMGESVDGYAPCPTCVIDAGGTFVAWD